MSFDLAGKLSQLASFDLWPTYMSFDPDIVEANIGHLPTKFGYKQAYKLWLESYQPK